MRKWLTVLAVLLSGCMQAYSQQVTVVGAVTPSNCVKWFSPTSIADAGTPCGSGGLGTVTSFSAGSLSPLFTTGVANPTSTPALSFSLSTVALANQFFANLGAGTTPAFRSIAAADLPAISLSSGVSGTLPYGNGGTGQTSYTTGSIITAGASQFGSLAPSLAGKLIVDQGASWAAVVMSGDCTLGGGGAITCLTSNGSNFGTFAFVNYASPPTIGQSSPAPLFTSDLTISGPVTVKVVVNTTGTYTISNSTDYFICSKVSGATATYNLPTSHNIGDTYVVKDCLGTDQSFNIRVCTTNGDRIDTVQSTTPGCGTSQGNYIMQNSNTAASPIFLDRAAFTWSGDAATGWIVN